MLNAFLCGAILVCVLIVVPLLLALIWSDRALLSTVNLSNSQPTSVSTVSRLDNNTNMSSLPAGSLVAREKDNLVAVQMSSQASTLSLHPIRDTVRHAIIDQDLWTLGVSVSGRTQVQRHTFSHSGFLLQKTVELPDWAWNMKALLLFSRLALLVLVNERDIVLLAADSLQTIGRHELACAKVQSVIASSDDRAAFLLASDDRHSQLSLLRLVLETEEPVIETFVLTKDQTLDSRELELTRLLAARGHNHVLLASGEHSYWYDVASEQITSSGPGRESQNSICVTQDGKVLFVDSTSRVRRGDGLDTEPELVTVFGTGVQWVKAVRGLLVAFNGQEYLVQQQQSAKAALDEGTQYQGSKKSEAAAGHISVPAQDLIYFPTRRDCSDRDSPGLRQMLSVGPLPDSQVACLFSDGSVDVLGMLNAFHLSDHAQFVGFSRGPTKVDKKSAVVLQSQGRFEKSGFVHELGETLVQDGQKLFWTFSDRNSDRNSNNNTVHARAVSSEVLQLAA
jgi:hypothetical protein